MYFKPTRIKTKWCSGLKVTASGDQTARLWDVISGELLGNFKGHQCSLKSVAFPKREKGNSLFLFSWSKGLSSSYVWVIVPWFNIPRGFFTCLSESFYWFWGCFMLTLLCFSAVFCTGGRDGNIMLWDMRCSKKGKSLKNGCLIRLQCLYKSYTSMSVLFVCLSVSLSYTLSPPPPLVVCPH